MLIINIYFYAIKLLNNINLLKRIFNGRYFLRLFKSCNLLLPKHILFIHIPKTGGSSFENYLNTKYKQSLFGSQIYNIYIINEYRDITLQHQFYNTIYRYKDILNVNFDNELKIITIVRNPYNRLVSDLFYNNLINKYTNVLKVYCILRDYIYSNNYDNHNVPQYKFITNEHNELINNIILFRTETLTNDIINYGFTDYNNRIDNKGIEDNKNYLNYLNSDSINLINQFYKKDFELFNYSMI